MELSHTYEAPKSSWLSRIKKGMDFVALLRAEHKARAILKDRESLTPD